MIDYICEVSKSSSIGTDTNKISQANCLLESFGNAKTTRNNNSSRFGRYTKLVFEPDDAGHRMGGCSVDHYLLERSRVVFTPEGERNYHIFYQLVRSGAGKQFGLGQNAEVYAYTADGAAITGFDDAKDFANLVKTMCEAGFSEESREDIFATIAAILHLGNVEFEGGKEGEKDSSKLHVDTMESMNKACSLLGVQPEALGKALTSSPTVSLRHQAPSRW